MTPLPPGRLAPWIMDYATGLRIHARTLEGLRDMPVSRIVQLFRQVEDECRQGREQLEKEYLQEDSQEQFRVSPQNMEWILQVLLRELVRRGPLKLSLNQWVEPLPNVDQYDFRLNRSFLENSEVEVLILTAKLRDG